MAFDLISVAEAVDGFVGEVDPACWQGDAAAHAAREIQRLENVLAGVRLLFVARVEATNAWKDQPAQPAQPAGGADGEGSTGVGDEGPGGKQRPARSAADWLGRQSGIGASEARRQMQAAKKLAEGELPATDAALRNGEITPAQAAKVAEGATADPGAEKELVAAARSGDSNALLRAVDEAKQRTRDDREAHASARRNRRVRFHTRGDGAFWLELLHGCDVGARILARLIPMRDQIVRDARACGHRISLEQASADALTALLLDLDPADLDELHTEVDAHLADQTGAADADEPEDTLFADADADEPVDVGALRTTPETEGSPGEPPRGSSSAHPQDRHDQGSSSAHPQDHGDQGSSSAHPQDQRDQGSDLPGLDRPDGRTRREQRQARDRAARCKVIVRIDHAAFRRGYAVAGELCEIAGVGPVPVSAIRALLPDAFVAAVVTDGHDVNAVAHLGRRFTALQETVIEFRQPVCAGCGNRARLENDHVVPYVDSRQTTTDAAQRLCDACHLKKTTAENRARTRDVGREPPDPDPDPDPDPEPIVSDEPDDAPCIDLREPEPGQSRREASSRHAGGQPRPDKVDEMIRRARVATRSPG